MITSFCEQLATDIKEIDVAVFVENLAYWIRKNAANGKHLHEKRFWSYNSYPAFAKLYPFWSEQTIRRIIKRAVKYGLILIGNFNKKNYDNTNWYTLTDKALAYYPALHGLILDTPVESDRPPVEIDRPIPKPLTTSSSNTTTTVSKKFSENKKEKPQSISDDEILAVYRENMPEMVQNKVADREISQNIKKMVKNWPKYQRDGKEFTILSFIDFLNFVREHYSFFIKPYRTVTGHLKKNSIRELTREKNIVKFVNGEFSA